MSTYLSQIYGAPAPQSEPMVGREDEMVQNSAGGYVFPVNDFTRLRRFLILGSEGGSYYAGERELTLENAQAVKRCALEDGNRTIEEIIAASTGNAPRNQPSLFALAITASFGNDDTRQRALEALPQVTRTGTHLLEFAAFADSMRGWGAGLRNAIGNWYLHQGSVENAAYQMAKYRQRNGWTHRDLLRKTHPEHHDNPEFGPLFQWVTQGDMPPADDAQYAIIHAYEQVQKNVDNPKLVAQLIREHHLPWEMIPQELRTPKDDGNNEHLRLIWEALYEDMGVVATIRNLSTLTRLGVISPMSSTAQQVVKRLRHPEEIRRSRIHPINILHALMTYRSGRGQRGRQAWTPVQTISDALDDAFDKSFAYAPQTGKRLYLAIDVSGSMGSGEVAGVPGLTPRMGAAAMAMAIARREQNYHIAAFADASTSKRGRRNHAGYDMMPLDISASDSLIDAMAKTERLPWGGTDCALPMLDAAKQNMPVDCFIIITDSESWAGETHASQALRQYREKTGIPAKMIAMAMVANQYSIADPNDAGMMDVVGFDASVPTLIADFISDPGQETYIPGEYSTAINGEPSHPA